MDNQSGSCYIHRTPVQYRTCGHDAQGGRYRFRSVETCILQTESRCFADKRIQWKRELKKVSPNAFLGAFDSQLTVIPEGDDIHEMLGWIMPRFNQFSVNRSYFSWLLGNNKEYVLDARIKGGERHMIMSNEYDRVFPMDIFPEYLVKAIIAGDIDRMEALGIYEVAPEDFALCEFVCSSKVEVQRIVRAGLDMLRAEMA